MSALVFVGLVVLGLGMALCLYRAVVGPTLFDRILAFDCLTFDVMGVMVLVSLRLETQVFIDVILAVALLGFLGTISLAMYLEGSLLD